MRERVRNQVTRIESATEMTTIVMNPHGLSLNGMPSMPPWKFMPYIEKIRVGMDNVMEMMVKMRITLFRLLDTIEANASVMFARTPL